MENAFALLLVSVFTQSAILAAHHEKKFKLPSRMKLFHSALWSQCATFLLAFASTVLAWSDEPASPPAFQMKVAQYELDQIIKQTDAEAIIKKIEASPERFPALTGLAVQMVRNSQAKNLGITLGCSIHLRANTPVEKLGSIYRQDAEDQYEAGELVWFDVEGNLKKSQVHHGMLGARLTPRLNLLSWYLFHGQRNAAWDNIVIAAIQQQALNTTNAESLWALACQRGYQHDYLSAYCGMYQAIVNGEVTKVAAFAKAMVDSKTEHQFPLTEAEWSQLFAMTGDASWLAEYIKRGKSKLARNGDLLDYYELHQQLKKEAKTLEPPSVLADKMKRTSFLEANEFNTTWSESYKIFIRLQKVAARAAREGKTSFAPQIISKPVNFFASDWMSPGKPVKNMDVSITFRSSAMPLGPTGFTNFIRCVVFGIANREHNGERITRTIPNDACILVMALDYGSWEGEEFNGWSANIPCKNAKSPLLSRVGVAEPIASPMTNMLPDFDLDGEFHTLRIVKVENQAEALLDGKRLILTHLPQGLDHPGVFLQLVGARIECIGFTADVLE